VEVNTIDSFQGQERDIIVMSCVRTGGIGFLSDTQRLNVALTRARCSLLLCGNFMSLQVSARYNQDSIVGTYVAGTEGTAILCSARK
jgi:superfamily I DNA and/or RNA helicase